MSAARRSTLAALVGLVALAIPGSPTAARQPAPPRAVGSSAVSAVVAGIRVSPQAPELKASPALVGRLRETPRAYFRFVSRRFTQAVCAQFRDARGGFPDVNLHGDSHLEQYAVTSLGRGLTDFDESARGPSFIDLVRFGVSLELAAREKDWPGEGRRAFGAFLDGYREALKNPDINSSSPPVVTRASDAFARDHGLALRRADAMIDADPVPASEIEASSREYVTQMLANRAGMPASFFTIKKAGRPTLGIGSALDEKYLFRIEGWSKEADDDQILEAKLVRPLSDVDCVRTAEAPSGCPSAWLSSPPLPFPFSGLFAHRGRTSGSTAGLTTTWSCRSMPRSARPRTCVRPPTTRGSSRGGPIRRRSRERTSVLFPEASCFRPRARTRVGSARPSTT